MAYPNRQTTLPSHIRPSSGLNHPTLHNTSTTSSLQQSTTTGHSASTSSNAQTSALQTRIAEKRAELESLRQLRDLSAGLAGQMQQLEDKLATLSSGTQAVAEVMGGWSGVLRAIYMASAKIPKPKAEDGDEGEGEVGDGAKLELPQTLVRIPVGQAEAAKREAEAVAAAEVGE